MASYVQTVLTKDEVILYTASLSLMNYVGTIFIGFLLLFFWGLGLLVWLGVYLAYISTELAVTNKRIIAKFGFISRKTIEINLGKIESIQVDQNILGRIFDFGSLVISGAGTPQAPIPGIKNPLGFRKAFVDAQEGLAAQRN